jgi:4-oxalocrotonate tautomerase
MPIVHVNVWEGWGPERANILIHHFTRVLEDLDIPKEAIRVIIHEVPKTHWGIAGEPASEKFKGPGRK